MNKEYQVPQTAEELYTLILSISDKFNSSDIITSLSGSPTNAQILGAAALKTIVDEINDKFASSNILSILNGDANFNNLTDAQETKLNKISDKFRGVYVDANERDVTLSDITGANPENVSNNDLILLMNSTSGLPALQTWNTTTSAWEDAFDNTKPTESSIATNGVATEIARFATTKATFGTYHINVNDHTRVQLYEVTISHNTANSVSLVATSKHRMGGTEMATFSAAISADNKNVILRCTVNRPNSKVIVKPISLV